MLAVLVSGFIGYVLGGWLGVAVGAGSATAVSVLMEPLTPRGDRMTAHERRMRRSRRYRTRYEALEEGWRQPHRPSKRTDWKAVDRRVADGATLAPPPPTEIVPLPVPVEAPTLALGAPKPKPAAKRKRAEPKEPKPTAARKPRTPRASRTATAPKPT